MLWPVYSKMRGPTVFLPFSFQNNLESPDFPAAYELIKKLPKKMAESPSLRYQPNEEEG